MADFTLNKPGERINQIFDGATQEHSGIVQLATPTEFAQGSPERVPTCEQVQGEDGLGGRVKYVEDSGGVRVLRNVASKYFDAANITGIVKIALPADIPLNNHNVFKIIGRVGSDSFELSVSGRITAAKTWANTEATIITNNKIFDKVKFGIEDGRACILLPLNKAVNNLGVTVNEVFSQHVGYKIPRDGWDISLITSEAGLTNVVETPVSWVVTDDGVWYDIVLAGGITTEPNVGLRYRRTGNKVDVVGGIYPNTASTITNIIGGTNGALMAGYRPDRVFSSNAKSTSGNPSMNRLVQFYTDGRIALYTNPNNTNANDFFYINESFYVN